MSNFTDMVKADLVNVHLNTDEMAETITYYPAGGGKRSITVHVIKITSENETTTTGLFAVFTLRLLCRNHATGGINQPKFQDYIVHDKDVANQQWHFKEVRDQTDRAFELEFTYRELLQSRQHSFNR